MGATLLGDVDEEEINLNSGNDKEYLGLCGIMALQDEITRGSALRDLKSKLGSLSAGVRKRPKMVNGSSRKANKRGLSKTSSAPDRSRSKKTFKCHNPSCKKQTPYCEDDGICMIDNILPKAKGLKRDKRKKTRRKKEKKCKEICPLGVLELAVPSKRLCIETWRQYSHVLPPYAIRRLKEIILDQKPIIEVSAAVECFNLHKKKCKKLALKRKKAKLRKMLLAKKKNRVPNRISRICARLAREILNYLKTPKIIKLEAEWARLSQVIYTDMRQMLKQMGARHLMNRHFLRDAAKKGAVWVGTILEQYEDMVVYDEIRDLEETEGPVLDIIDDILDAVLEYSEPGYNKLRNSESALNYFSGDISLAGEGGTRKGSHATHTSKGSHFDDRKGGSDFDNKRGLEDAGGTHKLGIKLGKDYDLDSDVRRDIIETAGEVTRSITDMAEAAVTKSLEEMEEARRKQLDDDDVIVLAKPRNAKSSESEVEADNDQDQPLNKNYEKDPEQMSASKNQEVDEMNTEVDELNKEADGNSETNQIKYPEEGIAGEANKANVENIVNDQVSIPDEFTNRETINNNIPSPKQEKDPEPPLQSDKDGKPHTEQSVRRSSNVTFQNKELKIGPVNEDLLNETWPKDIPFPVVKPSVSVTQSITTLGNITESEETVKDPAELTRQLSELLKTDVEDKPEKNAKEPEQQLGTTIHDDEDKYKTAEESQQPLDSEQVKELRTSDELHKTEEFKGQTEEFKGLTEEFKDPTEDFKGLNEDFKGPTDEFKDSTEEFKGLNEDFKDLTEEFKGSTEEFKGLTEESKGLTEEFRDPQEFITPDTFDKDLPSVSKPKVSDELTKTAELIDSTPKIEIEKPYKPKEIQQLIKDMDRDMKRVEDKRQKKQKPVARKSPSKPAKALTPTKKETKTIFDYKVRPETAPSWLLKRVCSCRTTTKEYDKNLQTCVLQKEQMKNVFRESENLVKSLELWNRWIVSTCEQIITLKETSDNARYVEGRCCATRCMIRQWRHLETNINQATEQWRHCKITTYNKLRRSQKLLFSKY